MMSESPEPECASAKLEGGGGGGGGGDPSLLDDRMKVKPLSIRGFLYCLLTEN